MKLTQLVVTGAALVSFGAMAADEPKQKQQMSQSHSPEMVKQVQEKLSSQGYDPGPADGKMGPKTQQALKKLQEDRSLKTSGQLDQQTLATLGLDQGSSASTGASGSASGGQSGQPQSTEKQSNEKPSTEKKY